MPRRLQRRERENWEDVQVERDLHEKKKKWQERQKKGRKHVLESFKGGKAIGTERSPKIAGGKKGTL